MRAALYYRRADFARASTLRSGGTRSLRRCPGETRQARRQPPRLHRIRCGCGCRGRRRRRCGPARSRRTSPQQRVARKRRTGARSRPGVIGCGGRGTGAAVNFLDAGSEPADHGARRRVPRSRRPTRGSSSRSSAARRFRTAGCFTGFDAYQKLLASDVDVVLHATPPHFRPVHMAAAVDAKKHLFLEKPLGGRRARREARDGDGRARGQPRPEHDDRHAAAPRVSAHGDVQAHPRRRHRRHPSPCARSATRARCGIASPQPAWSDMEYMIRDWVNWTWLSGDIIVEQHIHHLDAMLWVMGKTAGRARPAWARGCAGQTGDQYDFFSIDYKFDNGVHLHSTIRQLNGCANDRRGSRRRHEGARRTSTGSSTTSSGKQIWKYDGPMNDALVQEHADWVDGDPRATSRSTPRRRRRSRR